MYERLKKIRDMTEKGMVAADIGTDHALLPVMLIESKISPRVYACDVSKGPLSRAEETIRANHMESSIIPVLSDGFQNIPIDAKVAVIAGMGLDTAQMIFTSSPERIKTFHQVLLELHCDPVLTRKWIAENNWQINDESFLIEKGHGYTIISIHPSFSEEMSEEDIFIGPILKKKKDPVYLSWLKEQSDKAESILLSSHGHAPQSSFLKKKEQEINQHLSKMLKIS